MMISKSKSIIYLRIEIKIRKYDLIAFLEHVDHVKINHTAEHKTEKYEDIFS